MGAAGWCFCRRLQRAACACEGRAAFCRRCRPQQLPLYRHGPISLLCDTCARAHPPPPAALLAPVFKPHHGVHYGGMHYGHGYHGGFKHKGFKRPKFGFKRPKFGFKRPKFGKFGGKFGKWK